MTNRALIAKQLAAYLLAGAWTKRRLAARAKQFLGAEASEAPHRLIDDILGAVETGYPPSPRDLAAKLLDSEAFDAAAFRMLQSGRPRGIVLHTSPFSPIQALAGLPVPRLETPGDLAHWLNVPIAKVDWLAGMQRGSLHDAVPLHQHYSYVFAPKRTGPPRLIESPKPLLKSVQRRILHDILAHVPTHPSAHGFVRGRSCVTGASLHAGEHVVIRLDLQRYFPRIRAARVHGVFRAIGYPWATARLLTGLCTTSTPARSLADLSDFRMQQEYRAPHLPQGAPTSPMLANLCTWRLDHRLACLARRIGINYSRYADDLCFSGDRQFAKKVSRFLATVETIISEEDFSLNPQKTRVMHASGAQRVTGIVVNQHVNTSRGAYDALKATLHRCRVASDPATENRDGHPDFRSHLDGRIGWVEQLNPHRGMKLRLIFNEVKWIS